MSKNILVSAAVFVIATFGVAARAFPFCLTFVDFCDGVCVGGVGPNMGSWYHFDCANDSPLDVSKPIDPPYLSECGTNVGNRILRSREGNGPGAYYFLIDLPLDGTLDLIQGPIPPFHQGTCVRQDLRYNLQMGRGSALPHQNRSSIQ